MSCAESAVEFAREKATEIESKARGYGILRSVDATEASRWLWEMADAIRVACGDAPTPRRPGRKPPAEGKNKP